MGAISSVCSQLVISSQSRADQSERRRKLAEGDRLIAQPTLLAVAPMRAHVRLAPQRFFSLRMLLLLLLVVGEPPQVRSLADALRRGSSAPPSLRRARSSSCCHTNGASKPAPRENLEINYSSRAPPNRWCQSICWPGRCGRRLRLALRAAKISFDMKPLTGVSSFRRARQ